MQEACVSFALGLPLPQKENVYAEAGHRRVCRRAASHRAITVRGTSADSVCHRDGIRRHSTKPDRETRLHAILARLESRARR